MGTRVVGPLICLPYNVEDLFTTTHVKVD
jgi:hypothetical protein